MIQGYTTCVCTYAIVFSYVMLCFCNNSVNDLVFSHFPSLAYVRLEDNVMRWTEALCTTAIAYILLQTVIS